VKNCKISKTNSFNNLCSRHKLRWYSLLLIKRKKKTLNQVTALHSDVTSRLCDQLCNLEYCRTFKIFHHNAHIYEWLNCLYFTRQVLCYILPDQHLASAYFL